jgi:hypothetical protein
VDRHGSITFFAIFTLGTEATSMFGQPLSERCDFHQCSPISPPQIRLGATRFPARGVRAARPGPDAILELAIAFGQLHRHQVKSVRRPDWLGRDESNVPGRQL